MGTGIIITRAATDARLGQEIVRQVSAHPKTLGIVALALFLLMLLPGLPVLPLAVLALGFASAAWWSWRRITLAAAGTDDGAEATPDADGASPVDSEFMASLQAQPFELKLGAKLAQGLLGADSILSPRVDNLRRQLARELGITLPALAIRTEQKLAPNAYAIHIHGAQVATGDLELDRLLAINPGHIKLNLEGIATREPTYGLNAEWILPEQKNQARSAGYTLVEPETVLTTHLSELARRNACATGDFVETLPLAQSTVSQHLKVLREAGIIRVETMPTGETCYCLEPGAIQWLMEFCAQVCGPECGVS